jgi:hypothetical protein
VCGPCYPFDVEGSSNCQFFFSRWIRHNLDGASPAKFRLQTKSVVSPTCFLFH